MSRKPDTAEESTDKEMPFLEHLIELRSRILRSLALVALLFIPIYYYAEPLFNFVSAPLVEALPDDSSMIATQVTTPFLTPFKLAVYTAIFVGVPFLLHQLWGFVSPGLYRSEKRFAFPLLFSSVVLFYAGMDISEFLVSVDPSVEIAVWGYGDRKMVLSVLCDLFSKEFCSIAIDAGLLSISSSKGKGKFLSCGIIAKLEKLTPSAGSAVGVP